MGTCSTCERSLQAKQTEALMIKNAKTNIIVSKALSPTLSNMDPSVSPQTTETSINSETDDAESTGSNSKQLTEITSKSKIAMTSAYLISEAIFNHFMDMENKCEFMDFEDYQQMVQQIISNIYLQGKATREILLFGDIDDLYFICNTVKLNQIHLEHLQKYHSDKFKQERNCKCALWQIYLHKFEKNCINYDKRMFEALKYSEEYKDKQDLMKSPKYIHDCDYILNAKYLVHILINSLEFKDKLSCKIIHRPRTLIFALQIVGDLMYNNLNLDKQDFDFIDIPPIKTNLEILSHERRQIQLYHQKTRMELKENVTTKTNMGHFRNSSLHSKKRKSKKNDGTGKGEIKLSSSLKNIVKTTKKLDIEIPICKIEIEQHYIDKIDFSINSMVLSLFKIMEIMELTDDEKLDETEGNPSQCKELTHEIWGDLRSMLEGKCGDEYDVMQDYQQKVLRSTYKTISAKGNIYRHFWRTVKFGIEYYDKGWKIDPKLVEWYKELYGEWIGNNEWISSYKNQRVQVTQQFNYGHANNKQDYNKMMILFNILEFHEPLKKALKKNQGFKKKWIDELLKNDKEIINVFESNGYPTKFVLINAKR